MSAKKTNNKLSFDWFKEVGTINEANTLDRQGYLFVRRRSNGQFLMKKRQRKSKEYTEPLLVATNDIEQANSWMNTGYGFCDDFDDIGILLVRTDKVVSK